MVLNPVASGVIAVSAVLSMLISLILLGMFALALKKLNERLTEFSQKLDPLLIKADDILAVTDEKIHSIGDRAEGILAQGEGVAETVHEKVDRTATTVQRVVHAPIINLNSLAAGFSQGLATFGSLQRRAASGNGNGASTAAAVRAANTVPESATASSGPIALDDEEGDVAAMVDAAASAAETRAAAESRSASTDTEVVAVGAGQQAQRN